MGSLVAKSRSNPQRASYASLSRRRPGFLPAVLEHLPQLSHGVAVFAIAGEIDEFARIAGMIIQLDAFFTVSPFRVTPPFGAHAAAHHVMIASMRNLNERCFFPRLF